MFPLQLLPIDLRFAGTLARSASARIGGRLRSWSEGRIPFKEAAMNQLTSTSCARSWVIACALVSLLAPLSAHAGDWRMGGNDLTNDRNQPNETLIDIGNVTSLKPGWTF